jgi:hypothetical protein
MAGTGVGAGGAPFSAGVSAAGAGACGELPPQPERAARDTRTRKDNAKTEIFFMDVSSQTFFRFSGKVDVTG